MVIPLVIIVIRWKEVLLYKPKKQCEGVSKCKYQFDNLTV